MRTVQQVIERLRAEFVEMPGLRLSAGQVERLCGVEHTVCQLILDSLVDAKFLCRKPDGTYTRLTDGASSHSRPVTALRTDVSRMNHAGLS